MRVFLALLPSPSSLLQMSTWQDSLRDDSPGCRPVDVAKLHMTILFSGQAGPDELKKLERTGQELQEEIGSQDLLLSNPRLSLDSRSLSGLGILSFSDDQQSASLWKIIGKKVTGYGIRNPFWPHITLFRRFFPPKKGVLPLPKTPIFSFTSLILVESILHPEGSRYRIIEEWKGPAKENGGNKTP